jgi:hypothetical protein
MKSAYPQELRDLYETDINVLHSRILTSKVNFIQETSTSYGIVDFTHSMDSETGHLVDKRSRRSTRVYPEYFINNSSAILSNNTTSHLWNLTNKFQFEVHHDDRSHPIEVDLAHIFHYCSISILAILVMEVIID